MKQEQLKQLVFVAAFLLVLVHNVVLVHHKKKTEQELAELRARIVELRLQTNNVAETPLVPIRK